MTARLCLATCPGSGIRRSAALSIRRPHGFPITTPWCFLVSNRRWSWRELEPACEPDRRRTDHARS